MSIPMETQSVPSIDRSCRGRPSAGWRYFSAATRAAIVTTGGAILLGCGTDVKELLARDSQVSWQAYSAVEQAETLEIGLEEAIYDAEAVKNEACGPIYAAAGQSGLGATTFWKGLWSGLVQFVVRVVPIERVETCAVAHERFKEEIDVLRYRLEGLLL